MCYQNVPYQEDRRPWTPWPRVIAKQTSQSHYWLLPARPASPHDFKGIHVIPPLWFWFQGAHVVLAGGDIENCVCDEEAAECPRQADEPRRQRRLSGNKESSCRGYAQQSHGTRHRQKVLEPSSPLKSDLELEQPEILQAILLFQRHLIVG